MSESFPRRALAAALLAWPAALLASQTQHIDMQPGAPVEVAVECFHDSKPTQGFMPVKVTLRNDTDRELRYRLGYSPAHRFDMGGRVSGEFTLTVGPGARSASVVYIPVVAEEYQGTTQVTLTGPGIREGNFQLNSIGGYRAADNAHTGFGEGLASRHLGAIEAEVKKLSGGSGGNLSLTKISSSFAPGDRRAYDAFTTLWFEADEWTSLEPAARAAIREWVLLGGRLHLVSASGPEGAERVGLGEINRVARGDDPDRFAGRVAKRIRDLRSPVMNTTKGQPRLFSAFKSADVNRPIALILLLIAFGLVVGPVNLFVFAKPPRRHRLLWTTPLISLVAAVLLLGAILLTDGTGGRGARRALAVLDPASKRIGLWQQQISRTGLLLGSDFPFEPSAMLVPTQESASGRNNNEYVKTADGWGGDWFSGRAIRAQTVFDTLTARGAVRVRTRADGTPESVLSSLEYPLSRVVVVMPDGSGIYEATDLAPGVNRPLKAVEISAANALGESLSTRSGEALGDAVRALSGVDGHFYATLAAPSALLRPTLRSIEWTDDAVLLTGPAEFSAEPAAK